MLVDIAVTVLALVLVPVLGFPSHPIPSHLRGKCGANEVLGFGGSIFPGASRKKTKHKEGRR